MVLNTISVLEAWHILNSFSTSPDACSCDSRGAFYVNIWIPTWHSRWLEPAALPMKGLAAHRLSSLDHIPCQSL